MAAGQIMDYRRERQKLRGSKRTFAIIQVRASGQNQDREVDRETDIFKIYFGNRINRTW